MNPSASVVTVVVAEPSRKVTPVSTVKVTGNIGPSADGAADRHHDRFREEFAAVRLLPIPGDRRERPVWRWRRLGVGLR